MAAYTNLRSHQHKHSLFPFNKLFPCFLSLLLAIPDSCEVPLALLDPEDTRPGPGRGENIYEWLERTMRAESASQLDEQDLNGRQFPNFPKLEAEEALHHLSLSLAAEEAEELEDEENVKRSEAEETMDLSYMSADADGNNVTSVGAGAPNIRTSIGTGTSLGAGRANIGADDQQLLSMSTATAASGNIKAGGADGQDWWTLCQLPVFIVLFAVIGVLAVTILVLLWLKSEMLENEKEKSSKGGDVGGGGGQKMHKMLLGMGSTHGASLAHTHGHGNDERWIFHTVINLKSNLNPSPTPTIDRGAVPIPVPIQPHALEEKISLPAIEGKSESKEISLPVPVPQAPIVEPLVTDTPTAASGGRSPTPTASGGRSPTATPEKRRIRAKGLLERRGSNVSLTIDLPQANAEPPTHVITPTRECSAEEFLLSAGNSLCRSQLRTCLRDTGSLHREFWEIPLNHPEESVGCSAKNRYRSILPNERSRVVLQDLDDSYINANYVRGYDGEEKVYIATQGPLGNTVSDLYHMVWTQHCPIIVMMTHLVEKGKPKCEPYFPLGLEESATYGEFRVTVADLIHRQGYVLRHLLVEYKGEARTILHYWYDTWPDHKTPQNTHTILAMATEIEKLRTNLKNIASNNNERSEDTEKESEQEESESGPVVVHCSAGIGRTGCFIAISLAICQLLEESKVDLLGIVCQMRYDRGGMVQTAEQYEFVHRAVAMFESSLPDSSD